MSKTSPKHYQLRNGFQVIDLTSQLDFCSGNVVKYVARAGNKEGESVLDDLKKAEYYLKRLIDECESKREVSGPDGSVSCSPVPSKPCCMEPRRILQASGKLIAILCVLTVRIPAPRMNPMKLK